MSIAMITWKDRTVSTSEGNLSLIMTLQGIGTARTPKRKTTIEGHI